MRTCPILLATLAVLAWPTLAQAKPVCGPKHQRTLAQSGYARVYVDGGQARACHRGRSRERSFGPASRVLAARAAGSFVAVQRKTAGGQSLRVYNAYAGKALDGWFPHAARFTALALADNGIAAYVATIPNGRQLVSGTGPEPHDNRIYEGPPNADPAFVRIAGNVVAWKLDGVTRVQRVDGPADPGGARGSTTKGRTRLFTSGQVEVSAAGAHVSASGAGRRVSLGAALGTCRSAQDCFGLTSIRIAGPIVGIEGSDDPWDTTDFTVLDLTTGTSRTVCRSVIRAVLTAAGNAACSEFYYGRRIKTEDAILDEGDDVDPDSLEQRGDQLRWLRAGVERSAPLGP